MPGALQSGRRRRRAHGRKSRNASINVTPFVDVMLVMLIVFMVTAPLLQVGIELNPPRTDAKQLPAEADPLTVSIQKDGTIYLQETRIDPQDLLPRLTAIAREGYDRPIFVRGDEDVPYGRVAEVMSVIASAGLRKINLVNDPRSAARATPPPASGKEE